MNVARKRKPRRCSCGCGERFTPIQSFQTWATDDCAIRIIKMKRAKEKRKDIRRRLTEIKPLSWWKAKAQKAFNEYIRNRDKEEACISCGRWHDGQWHAGHFLSIGARPELRFNEDNVNKQCSVCNTHKSGNQAEYRRRLMDKVGVYVVESLEGPHPSAHYTREDCQRIEAEYKAKLKALRSEERM